MLTILGDYVWDHPRQVWSGGLVRLLEDFGFTTASARLALSRLSRRGLVASSKRGRLTFYELTHDGHTLLAEGRRRLFSFGRDEPWDGRWTILSYSLPEERRADRERLRKRLSFLGFGSAHDGTWLSPRDRVDAAMALLGELGLERDAHIFRGWLKSGGDVADVINRCWDLRALRDRYERYVADLGPYATPQAQRELDDATAFIVRTRATHEYRRFPSADPELPEEIVGSQWARGEAVAVFRSLWEGLRPAAYAAIRSCSSWDSGRGAGA